MIASTLMFACCLLVEQPDADPRAMLDRCCTYYRGLPGFSVTLSYTPPATPVVPPGMTQEHRLDFSGAKPDKIRITQHIPGIGEMDIIGDGQSLIMSLPAQNVFSRHAAPTSMPQARREIQLGGAVDGMSDLCFNLLESDPAAALLADSQRLTREGTTTIGEITCDILRLHPRKSEFVPEGMSVDLLIAQREQPWILGYNINLPAMEERGIPEPDVIEIRARDWKIVEENAKTFAFTPGEAVQVESLSEELRKQAHRTTPPPPADVTPPGVTP